MAKSSRYAVEIELPIDRAFELLSDPNRIPEWNDEVERIELIEGDLLTPGSRYVAHLKIQGREFQAESEVIECAPPKMHGSMTNFFGAHVATVWHLRDLGDRTEVRVATKLAKGGPLMRLMCALSKKRDEREAMETLAKLKHYCERIAPLG